MVCEQTQEAQENVIIKKKMEPVKFNNNLCLFEGFYFRVAHFIGDGSLEWPITDPSLPTARSYAHRGNNLCREGFLCYW